MFFHSSLNVQRGAFKVPLVLVLTLLWMFGSSCIASTLPKVVKWHPGHYILLPQNMGRAGLDKVLEEISDSPQIRGIQKRYTWSSLEPAEGEYDFTEVIKDLEACAKAGKRLVMQIQGKSFRKNAIYVPSYLLTPRYDGGVVEFQRGGSAPKLWEPAVLERLKALYANIGGMFDKNPILEAVIIPETALGKLKDKAAKKDRNGYLAALIDNAEQVKKAFPTTVVIQYINWPPKAVESFARLAVGMSLGIGGPDVFPYASKLNNGVYQVYSQLAGMVPIGVAVQYDNYTAKFPRGPHDPTSIQDIYAFARDELYANYIFWLYRKTPSNYFLKVRDLIDSESKGRQFTEINGGLSHDCPKVFASCLP